VKNIHVDGKEFIDQFLKDGWGYGDPEARSNDDRKIAIFLAKQQKIQERPVKAKRRFNFSTCLKVIEIVVKIIMLFKR